MALLARIRRRRRNGSRSPSVIWDRGGLWPLPIFLSLTGLNETVEQMCSKFANNTKLLVRA